MGKALQCMALIGLLLVTNVALAQRDRGGRGGRGGQDRGGGGGPQGPMSPDDIQRRMAMLDNALTQMDTNHNGMIEESETKEGYGGRIIASIFERAGQTPTYPIAISQLKQMRLASYQASSQPGATPPGQRPGWSPAGQPLAAPTGFGMQPPPGTPPGMAPPPAAPAGMAGAAPAPAAASTAPADASAAKAIPRKSARFHTAKELLPKGLPDWFLQKMDDNGQITMAEWTTDWTAEEAAKFAKYDLNGDGIITAAEALKVEKMNAAPK